MDDEDLNPDEEEKEEQDEAPNNRRAVSAAVSEPTERRRGRAARDREIQQLQEVDEPAQLVKVRFLDFLTNFGQQRDGDEDRSQSQQLLPYYQAAVQEMLEDQDNVTLFVDFCHLVQFDFELAEAIEVEYYRFEPYLRQGLQSFIVNAHPEQARNLDSGELREFAVSFYGMPVIEKVRQLRTNKVGRLSSFSGTVTRTTDVRPELIEGTFNCGKCGLEAPRVTQQFQYTVPALCKNPHCTNTNDWTLSMEKSRFADWQRLRVQENADEIPPGSMPRSVDVVLRGQTVEKAKAGDKAVFVGVLVVVPDGSQLSRAGESAALARSAGGRSQQDAGGVTGLKRLGVRELTYRTAFIAGSVQPTEQVHGQHNIRADDKADVASEFTDEERSEIARIRDTPLLYNKLVDSVAPAVFGHAEIKRGILLMLFGGVHKRTKEGIKLRGDINVCIVGDPSTSKSQFLKYVHGFLPRAIYTSGKASSAAGLTASIARDPETGEFCVEAGALMLADNGICCIDEFDKMDIGDQVAIHEAMEQQTISITKAGIQATLNARTSILAAANPLFGRYDRTKTLKANVQISAPIMSRFDLFFVVLDDCDETSDFQIADHIIAVHRQKEAALNPPFSAEQLQRYIRFARSINPEIGDDGAKMLVECYRLLRQGDCVGKNKTAYRVTVRQLESLIRLSEALARLHLDEVVRPRYVREAFRLLQQSIIRVEADDIRLDGSDDESPQTSSEQQAEELENHEQHNGSTEKDSTEQQDEPEVAAPQKKKIQITYEKYQQIANSIAIFLRQKEERENVTGMTRQEILDWYIEEHEQDLGSEDDIVETKLLVNKVITRLIKKDGVLMRLGSEEEEILGVHPNYEIS